MIDLIKQLANADYKQKYHFDIIFKYQGGYRNNVWCECHLLSTRKDGMNFRGFSDNGDAAEALEKAMELVSKIEQLKQCQGVDYCLYIPTDADQNYENGYFRQKQFHREEEIEWKRCMGKFLIVAINRIDKNDFYYCSGKNKIADRHDAMPFDENLKGSPKSLFRSAVNTVDGNPKDYLNEGEELWIYDNIRCLSGSAGFLIVKDGYIIKQKTMMIS